MARLQLLPAAPQEEKDRSCMFADELAKMEAKFKEQLKINDNLKLQLAAEEDRYKVSGAERRRLSSQAGLRPTTTSHTPSPLLHPGAGRGCFSSGRKKPLMPSLSGGTRPEHSDSVVYERPWRRDDVLRLFMSSRGNKPSRALRSPSPVACLNAALGSAVLPET